MLFTPRLTLYNNMTDKGVKMKYMYIYTPYGNKYVVDLETGNITHFRWSESPVFSGGWKFKGIQHVKKSEFISLETIKNNPKILDEINLTYKNGNPQYTVRDVDHGTVREWGNTKHHGISSISLQ